MREDKRRSHVTGVDGRDLTRNLLRVLEKTGTLTLRASVVRWRKTKLTQRRRSGS